MSSHQSSFDWVNRDFLLYKLITNFDVNGKLYWAIKALLNDSKSCIKINGKYTDYFSITSGVRQGDCISPTLFNFFINDLAIGIKDLNLGVNTGHSVISILLYADDIVLLSESEIGLQHMLNFLSVWCKTWHININETKSNIIHFRKSNRSRTQALFKFDNKILQVVDEYRYLGFYLNEYMNMEKSVIHLATAGTRALGAIRNKLYNIKNIRYKSYSKLYQTGIAPIIDYCSAVWGYKSFKCIQDVQNRAIRYYLGVHKFCPLSFLEGDMGWANSLVRSKLNMINFWNHLIELPEDRIPKKMLRYNIRKSNSCNNWFTYLNRLTNIPNPEELNHINLQQCLLEFNELQTISWNDNRYSKVKLRYYNIFKSCISPEPYVIANLSKSQRSAYAQFRAGILPLSIETGRFTNVSLNDRICLLCNSQLIEDEFHFLCECVKYILPREKLYNRILTIDPNFLQLDNIDKFILLNSSDYQCYTAIYVYEAYYIRKKALYCDI